MVDIPGYPQGNFKHIHRYSIVSADHICGVIIILGICMFPLARFLKLMQHGTDYLEKLVGDAILNIRRKCRSI